MDAQLGGNIFPASKDSGFTSKGDSLPAAYFLHLSQLRRVPSSTTAFLMVGVCEVFA